MKRLFAVVLVSSAALLSGCSDNASDSGPTTSAADAALEHVVVSCSALDPDAFPAGEITEISDEQVGAAQCVLLNGGGPVELEGALSIVPSGRDRIGMDLVAENAENVLGVDVEVPAQDCAVTMEWRGDMALLIADVPAGATVELSDVEVDCEN